MEQDQLKGYFAFDENDLLANRNGKLSEKQSRKRKDVDQFAERFVLVLFLIFLAITLVLDFFAVRAMTNVFLWVWTAIALIIAIWLFRGVTNKVDDSLQNVRGKAEFVKIERLSGSPTDSMSNRHMQTFYELHVGRETFQNVNPALIEYMQDCVFVVYYTKTTKQILSVDEV